MSNTNGVNSLARSMNGIITIDDGAGTVIQNGVVTTNGLQTNNVLAEFTNQPCSLFANSTSSGVSLGNPNNATYVRSYWTPVSGYDVINYAYLTTTYYTNLLGLKNIWTGVSNTFQHVVYALSFQPLTASSTLEICRASSNILSMGNATGTTSITGMNTSLDSTGSLNIGTNTTTTDITIGNSAVPTTLIKNSNALVIGKNPETYVVATGLMSAPGIAFKNVAGSCQLGFHSNTLGNTENDARILVQSGTASGAATADMTIQAGTIQLLGTSYVKVESFTFNVSSLQSTNPATTVDFFNNGNTTTLNIGNTAISVNIGGTSTKVSVNGFYNHGFSAGSGLCWHDFHSCSTATNNYDGKILCSGGTSGSVNTGAMQYSGASHKFVAGGISFDKGPLQTPFFIQSGVNLAGPAIAANSLMAPNWAVTFASMANCVAFPAGSTILSVSLTLQSNNTAASGIILSIFALSRTTVTIQAYNSNGVNAPAGSWGVSIMAFGTY